MPNASVKAYKILRDMILNGTYGEGAHLKEADLVQVCNASRTPVRDALRRLEVEKYVENRPNQGTFVIRWSVQEMDDIFVMRAGLEGFAAARATQHLSESQIDALAASVDAIDKMLAGCEADISLFLTENAKFHSIIINATKSAAIERVLAGLVQPPLVVRLAKHYGRAHFKQSNEHHKELICAFRARDPEWAKAVMESHVRAARRAFLYGVGVASNIQDAKEPQLESLEVLKHLGVM